AVLRATLYRAHGQPARAGDGAAEPGAARAIALQTGGCACQSGGGGAGGALGGLALIGLAWLALGGGRRRRGRAGGGAAALAIALSGGLLGGPGCSCGGDPVECAGEDGECLEGEVERGPTGRWLSLAVSGDRLVGAAYEESLGDLVFFEIGED